jgi:hypothetical protein
VVQTDAKGETGATMARMIREEGILPERSEWFRSSGIIGTAEGYCVDNRWLSTGGGNENAVYRKAEEPYGCGWVRNRQRRSWGGSDHTRFTDEAPILTKHRGFIP